MSECACVCMYVSVCACVCECACVCYMISSMRAHSPRRASSGLSKVEAISPPVTAARRSMPSKSACSIDTTPVVIRQTLDERGAGGAGVRRKGRPKPASVKICSGKL